MDKEDVKQYFEELRDIPLLHPNGFAPDDCDCPFKIECRYNGALNLCDVILRDI